MKSKEDLVEFHGKKIKKYLRNAYMNGYCNPWGTNPYNDDLCRLEYERGQIASRQESTLEGTF